MSSYIHYSCSGSPVQENMSVRAAVMLIGETKEFLVVAYGALFSVSARDLGRRERRID